MSLQRQTYLVLGLLVEIGLLLAVIHSVWWLVLPALLGLGMITAAAFGVCNMTRMLSWLPWNERHSGDITAGP
jgi:hypothetical protein